MVGKSAPMDERVAAEDERWELRFASLEHRLTATLDQLMADGRKNQMRTLMLTQLAAVIVIVALALGVR
jgi:hypothetical protein